MSEENFNLGFILNFVDHASGGILNAQRTFESATASAQTLSNYMQTNTSKFTQMSIAGAGLSSVGNTLTRAGGGVISSLQGMLYETTSLQKEMTNLQFVSGLTGSAFDQLKQKAMETGLKTMYSPQEATQGLYELISAGLDAKSSMQSLNDALNFSTLSGGVVDLTTSTSLMGSTLKKFNLDASESSRIVDEMAQATKISNFHFQDFSAFMNSLQSAPTISGRPMEEFLAMGGVLRNIGQGSAQAGSTINGFTRKISQLTRQTEMATTSSAKMKMKLQAMSDMGLSADTFWDENDKMRSYSDILNRVITQIKDMGDKAQATKLSLLFGDQAQNVIYAVQNATKDMLAYDDATGQYVTTTKEGKMTIDQMTESIKNSNNVAQQGVTDMQNTWWGVQKIFEGTKQTLSDLMGQTLIPLLSTSLKAINSILVKVVALFSKYPIIAKVLTIVMALVGGTTLLAGKILKIAGAFMMVVPGILQFSLAIKSLALAQGIVITGGKSLIAFLGGSLKTVLTGVALSFAKVGLVVGGMYLAWKYDFMGVRSLLNWFINGVHLTFSEVARISALGTTDFLLEVARLKTSNKFIDKVILAILRLKYFFLALAECWNSNTLSDDTFRKVNELGLLPLISTILDIKAGFESLWEGIKQGVKEVSSIFVKLGSVVWSYIEPLVTYFSSLLDGLFQTKEEINGIVKVTDGINPSKWQEVGKWIGRIVAILGTMKITSMIASIGTKVASLGSKVLSLGGVLARVLSKGGSVLISFLGGSVRTLIKLFGSFGKVAIGAIKGIGVVLKAGFITTPVGWIVLAVAGAIALFVILYKKCKWFRDGINEIVSSISEWTKWLWQDTIKPLVDDAINSLAVFWQNIKGDAIDLWENALKPFINWIKTEVVQVVTKVVENIKECIERNKQNFQDFFSGLQQTFGGVVKIITGIFQGDLSKVFEGLKQAVGGIMKEIGSLVNIAMTNLCVTIKNFFGIDLTGVLDFAKSYINEVCTFIGNVISVLIDYFSGIIQFLVGVFTGDWSQAWDGIKQIFSSWKDLIGVLCDRVKFIFNTIVTFLSTVVQTGFNLVWTAISNLIQSAVNIIQGIMEYLKNILQNVVNFVCSTFVSGIQAGFSAFSNIVSSVINTASSIINSIKGVLSSIVSYVAGTFTNSWSNAWNGVKNVLSGIFSTVGGILKAPINAGISAVNSMIRGINSLSWTVPDWVPEIGGKSFGFSIPQIPKLSTGGYILDEGISMLHPNEVVVNAPTTKRLDNFLKDYEGGQDSTLIKKLVDVMSTNANTSNSTKGDSSINIQEGAIQIIVQNAQDLDVDDLATRIKTKIDRMKQVQDIRNYA